MTGNAASVQYILFTDIGRSTYLWENFPDLYPAALEVHNHLMEDTVTSCGGVVMKNLGDGYIALFPTANSALQAAVELQLGLSGQGGLPPIAPFPDGSELLVRAIVHSGPLQKLSAGLGWFGPPLNRSARICAVCHPGQVLISGSTQRVLEAVPADCVLDDLGPCRLRDMGEPEQLFQVTHNDFAKRQFPPLVTLDSRPNNLTSQPNAFVGREQELRTLARMLASDTRLLTLHAPGGYGKSRLAIQLCANMLGRFEHGVFEVQLAPLRDPERLPEVLAAATGYQFTGTREPGQQVLDFLRSKEMLLYFDNFEHVLDGADFVAEILKAAPKVRVLTTSREPLRLTAERVYRLEPLPTGAGSASVELFADRAALVRHDFALDEEGSAWIERICEKLEGIPLAIELFAAWTDDFTLEEMHAQLDRQLEQTARMRDVPVRQRSVRASCDWSWNLLAVAERETLMRLAPFRGGFLLEAAQAVLESSVGAVREKLGRLSDKSWLYQRQLEGKPRYSIRDAAAWEYAWEKLSDTRETQVVTDDTLFERAVVSHAGYFSGFAEEQGMRLYGDGTPRGQIEALQAWRGDLANVDEALDTSMAREALALMVPVARHFSRFLNMVGNWLHLRHRYTVLLETARRMQSPELELSACLGLGRALVRLGGYEQARELNPRACELAQQLGDKRGEATALVNSGMLEYAQGHHPEAREYYERALEIQRGIGDQGGEAAVLHNLGVMAAIRGDYPAARECYRNSLEIKQHVGDVFGEASTLNSLGGVEGLQGEFLSGKEMLTRARSLFSELGDRSGESNALNGLANVEYRQHNFEEAKDLFRQSLAIKREIGDRNGESWLLGNLGAMEFCLGNLDAANSYFEQALVLLRELGNRFAIGRISSNLAHVVAAQGDFGRASELYRDSLLIETDVGDKTGTVITCAAAAAPLAALGQLREACMCLYSSRSHARVLKHSFGPDDECAIAAADKSIGMAQDSGAATRGEVENWMAEGEGLTLDELATLCLEGLKKATSAVTS